MTFRNLTPILAVFILALSRSSAHAAITYDAELNRAWVKDFPADLPCTLDNLLNMDEAGGWGKVILDEATNTYTIALDLWIGDHDGTETYFQVGGEREVTVVMKGDLVVHPFFIREVDEGLYYRAPRKINRLTLGSPKGAKVTLKFDCEKKNQYSLFVGSFPTDKRKKMERRGYGGELFAYNALITAATQDKARTWGGPGGMVYLCGNRTTLHNTTLSWATKSLTYGMQNSPPLYIADVRNCVFEHALSGLINGKQLVRDSVFRHLDIAVMDYGSINAKLIGCTFENNKANWELKYTKWGTTCIDCEVSPPLDKDIFRTATTATIKTVRYPKLTLQRHVIVEVVGADGKPVEGADVRVTCDRKDPTAGLNTSQKTGADGRTPGRDAEKAILLTDTVKQVTDTPNEPDVREYSYTVEASAPDQGKGRVEGYRPTGNWAVVRVKLEK